MKLSNKEYYAKGKRGIASLATYKGMRVLVKEHNPQAAVDTISYEATILQQLNTYDIGPKFIAYDEKNRMLIREFIEGEEFVEYLESANKKEIFRVLTEIFYQCRKMDLLGINKLELTRPYKHIFVTTKKTAKREKGSVVQIDFERCTRTEHPKNVTQFVQCVLRGRLSSIFAKHNIVMNESNLLDLTKKYKHSYDIFVFEQIISEIHGEIRAPSGFVEKVYDVCARVPYGKVIDYKGIAHAIGTNAYQAIGQALKRNPYAPRIPCHRVVRNDLSIGGFMGHTKGEPIERKKKLLEDEGVIFDENTQKLQDKTRLIVFENKN